MENLNPAPLDHLLMMGITDIVPLTLSKYDILYSLIINI